MTRQPLLSIVLPAFNEAGRIPHSIRRLCDFLSAHRIDAEVLVVDDGSNDATADAARAAASNVAVPVRVIGYSPNRGKGYAVRTGLSQAGGRIVGFTDADLPIDLGHILDVLRILDGDADLVIGSKWMRGAECLGFCPFRRRAMSSALNVLTRLFLGLPYADTQCGFKFMTRRAADLLLPMLTLDGFGFDMELLFAARCQGLRVVELPVRWQNPYAGSAVRPLRDGLRMLGEIAAIRLRAIRGQYRRARTDSS